MPLLVVVEREQRISARMELVAHALATLAGHVTEARLPTLPPRRPAHRAHPPDTTARPDSTRSTRLSA